MPKTISSVEYHDILNPKLWVDDEMLLDVRVVLLRSAAAFCDFIDLPDLKIVGIHFTGSNASYNYTTYSDCDVHIVIDFDSLTCPELADNILMTKKALWNQTHENVTVMGYKVEIYPEDTKNPAHSEGVYDLLNGVWLHKPRHQKPKVNSNAVATKVKYLSNEIQRLVDAEDIGDIKNMFGHLRDMRKAGLEEAGEFSIENLAFKELRNRGEIEKLAQARLSAQDASLSLLDHPCTQPICETPEGGLSRCTVQTVNAFAAHYGFPPITHESDIPVTGEGVIDYLRRFGLKMKPDLEVLGTTVANFVNTHRTGTWYISTAGHAMAVINGELIDAAQEGPDNRKIVSALEFRR